MWKGCRCATRSCCCRCRNAIRWKKIVLKGNWAFLDSTLFSQITSFPASGTDTVAIRQLRQQVLDFYILEGYLDARVEVEVVNLDYTSVLVIQIREGSPYVVTDTSFVGRSETGSPPLVLPGTFFSAYTGY